MSAREGRRFGLTVGMAFIALGALLWWRTHEQAAMVAGSLGGLLVLAGLLLPTRLGPVQAAWMKMALMISKVTTPIFMSVVYFIVLTPVSLLIRLVKYNPLKHKRTDSGYWVKRSTSGSSLERQF